MPLKKEWETVSSKIGYNHPFFQVREDEVKLPNGHTIPDFTVWVNGPVAQVLALTPKNEIILARQFKHGAGMMVTECPGGYMEKGEDSEAAVKRELLEEVGYTAEDFYLLGQFRHHPTKEESETFFYIAFNAALAPEGARPEITEDIEILLISFKKALEMIDDGELFQTGTVAGILKATRYLDSINYDYKK
jgi:8-oxo-dGTP pyrophosphatase MutT (NUDIX family)